MKQKKMARNIIVLLSMLMIVLSGCAASGCLAGGQSAMAETAEVDAPLPPKANVEYVEGKVYTFDADNAYHFSTDGEPISTNDAQTYGKFSISGTGLIADTAFSQSAVSAFSIPESHAFIWYTYSDELLNAPEDEWHLVDDNTNSIDVFKIDHNIQKGAVILQKSMDHLNWYDISVQTNVFMNNPVQNGVLYETSDMEMINGCYYRLIVVYEMARKVGTSKVALVIPKDEIEYKRTAEVYEFYVANKNEHMEPLTSNTKRYALGKTALVSDYASYSGEKEISKSDLHYGWELGNFFVSGFTSSVGSGNEVVFLKNAGDVVTLWFHLTQNISALNNDGGLAITSDTDGYDQYFQTPMTNFGKGMLIIRYTDYENVKHDPVMYYDYLLANTMVGANTRVQLFEEGDYEVALDYEVTRNQLIPQTHHYRIFFKFSVRNANCMVYPFDVSTGAELTNRSVTENGFYLDLARSRYLNLYIRKEVWNEGADGLTEDTRFNTAAKDGDRYTDEGIYTITAKNQYTGKETTKKIYVGTNRVLAAYANSNYSVAEIQRMVEQGATIYEDGTISMPDTTQPVVTDKPTDAPLTEPITSNNKEVVETSNNHWKVIVSIIIVSVILSLVIVMIQYRRKRHGKEEKR